MAKKNEKNDTPSLTAALARPLTRKARALRACLGVILGVIIVLGWVACLSYDPADPPGTMIYPTNERIANLAGPVGAVFSHFVFHWLGIGVWLGLLFGAAVAIMAILGKPLKDMWLRLIGLALAMAALATWAYLAAPHSSDSAVTGGGGIVGVGLGVLLKQRVGAFSWTIAAAGLLIGLILAAEEVVLKIPAWLAAAWKRRKAVATLMTASPSRQGPATTVRAAGTAGPTPKAATSTTAAPKAKEAVKAAAEAADSLEKQQAERVSIMQAAELAKKQEMAESEKKTAADKQDKPQRGGILGGLFGSSDEGADDKKAESPSKPTAATTPPQPAPAATPATSAAPTSAPAKRTPARPATKPSSKPGDPPVAGDYPLPDVNMLIEAEKGYVESQQVQVELKSSVLQQTLNDFNVDAEVIGHMTGPVITMFELSLAPGVKVSRIASLSGDIARALAAPSVRIVSPIPGKDTIGIEVPNAQKETVRLKQLMELAHSATERFKLPLFLGKDASGDSIIADLAAMPHMLIAGTTGSGKSVCINTIILSLLMTRRPEDVRLILVDPKMVEMAAFERIPHLLCPIVNDMHKAESILEWAATKMDERYEILKEAGVRNIAGYNALGAEKIYKRFGAETDEEKAAIPTSLPYMVIIVDELADLIMTSSKEVEEHIIRIAQKARAVGIHLILATQRPSANVVTGLIKSNMPCRVSFQVASGQESRIVLDQKGAELLLGRGDMLFLKPGTSMLVRAQGTYLDDSEIHDVVEYITEQRAQSFNQELVAIKPAGFDDGDSGERDELFDKAVEIILAAQRGSVSLLQRRLSIGYTRSSRIVDQMAEAGILGDYKGSQARECMMTLDDWHALQASIVADRSGANSLNGEPTSE